MLLLFLLGNFESCIEMHRTEVVTMKRRFPSLKGAVLNRNEQSEQNRLDRFQKIKTN